MGRVEVLSGRERRRRWSDAEKLRLLSEAGDGISLAEVARRHDLCPQQLYAWRRSFKEAAGTVVPMATEPVSFLAVDVPTVHGPGVEAPPSGGTRRRSQSVEVALANGRRLRVEATIDPDALRRLVQALEQA